MRKKTQLGLPTIEGEKWKYGAKEQKNMNLPLEQAKILQEKLDKERREELRFQTRYGGTPKIRSKAMRELFRLQEKERKRIEKEQGR